MRSTSAIAPARSRSSVVSDQFARTFLPDQNPLGRHIQVGGSVGPVTPLDLEIVGVAATARYGAIKFNNPPVIYVPYSQLPARAPYGR